MIYSRGVTSGLDVWVQGFAAGSDPVPALMQVFGIDEVRAIAIQQTVPRVVKRNAAADEAEQIAAALRAIGAKVELRPSRTEPASGVHAGLALPTPGPEPSPEPHAEPPPLDASLVPLPPEVEAPAPPREVTLAAGAPPTGLELAFDPSDQRTRAPRSAPRPSVEPLEPAPKLASSASTAASTPTLQVTLPGWLRGLGIALLVAVAGFGLRAARCYCAMSDAMNATPEEIAAMEAEAEADLLEDAIDVNAFLARPHAQLGRDMDVNAGLATTLRQQGAVRVLVADVIQATGVDMAMTLIVELPSTPAQRRRLAATVEGYVVGDSSIRPADVEPPEADERYLFVDLE